MLFISITIIWGAYVAGLDAGLVYNSWPKMGIYWIPPELQSFISIFTDPVSVQFTHRWIAMLTGIIVLGFAYRVRSLALVGAVLFQVGLGILILLSQVSIVLAAMHQAGAFILIAVMVYQLQKLHKKK